MAVAPHLLNTSFLPGTSVGPEGPAPKTHTLTFFYLLVLASQTQKPGNSKITGYMRTISKQSHYLGKGSGKDLGLMFGSETGQQLKKTQILTNPG